MKRCITLLLALLLLLSACGTEGQASVSQSEKSSSTASEPASSGSSPEMVTGQQLLTDPAEDLRDMAADFALNFAWAFSDPNELNATRFCLWKIYYEDPDATENGILWVDPERLKEEVELRFDISDYQFESPEQENVYPRYVEEKGAIAFYPVGEGSRYAVELIGQETEGEYQDYIFDIYDDFITDGHEERTLETTLRYRFRVVESNDGSLFLQAVSATEETSGAPSEPDPTPDPEPSQSSAGSELIQPPAVPHGAELADLDFSAMDKAELIDLLQPVLDRARFFCKFGMSGEIDYDLGVTIDFNTEAAIHRPHPTTGIERGLHPCLNLPYRTIDELKQDMCTVFTPNILEEPGYLWYIFQNIDDYDGRLYVYGGGGYSKERFWELDQMEIVSAEKSKLTISAPVMEWGPSQEKAVARLNFGIVDGYIIMDESYFARIGS